MRPAGDRPDNKALEEVRVSDEQRSDEKAPEVEKESEQMEDLELQEQDAESITGGRRPAPDPG
jgi:hypothetical protein